VRCPRLKQSTLLWLGQLLVPVGLAVYGLVPIVFSGQTPSDRWRLTFVGLLLWIVSVPLMPVALRGKYIRLFRASASLWVLALTWTSIMVVLRVTHVQIDLEAAMGFVRERLAGKPIDGKIIGKMFCQHPRYGWWHEPIAQGRQQKYDDFDVLYSTDENCFRVTPTPPKPATEILCLGCSFTFGAGVADDQNYPAILGKRFWSDFKVRNAGVCGWGTSQAVLLTEDYFASHPAPALVLYGWIAFHPERNFLRKSWLEANEAHPLRHVPYFELEGDGLAFRGLRGPEAALPDSPALLQTELELSARMLAEIGRICRKHGSRFVVVLLPCDLSSSDRNRENDAVTDEVKSRLGARNLEFVDVRHTRAEFPRESLYFSRDNHPRPLWHERIAQSIADAVIPRRASE
jgi:hypothetical protein